MGQLVNADSYDVWYWRFSRLAESRNFDIGHKHEYRDYYEDGDTPEMALHLELEAATFYKEQGVFKRPKLILKRKKGLSNG